jgi:hypothetical protein
MGYLRMNTDIKKKDSTEVAMPSDVASAMEQYAGAGLENTDQDDFALPFIYIVQKSSPIIDENPEARPGMFLNTVTGELYEGLEVIPCSYKKEFVEWIPHKNGGGIVGTHDYDSGIDDDAEWDNEGKFMLKNGNQLVDTRYHYVLAIDPGTGETFPAVIAMSSTQLKKSKKWMSFMSNRKIEVNSVKRQAPMFAFSYNLSTVSESNDKGKWHGWNITPANGVSAMSLVEEAITLYKGAQSGEAKVGDLSKTEQANDPIDGESVVM